MQELTPDGERRLQELAHRYGTSGQAAVTLLHALVAGGGTMAQFNHPDLGGMGQWSQGGMIMVGDMFNSALKAKIGGLCDALAGLLADQSNWQQQPGRRGPEHRHESAGSLGDASPPQWWGTDLGTPSSTGAQNATRYAYFPGSRRLAIDLGGKVTIHDTGDHRIGGVSQQQSSDSSLTFTSQHGLVRIGDLPVVPADAAPSAGFKPTAEHRDAAPGFEKPDFAAEAGHPQDIVMLIERLAALRDRNILSEDEFSTKKAELLARL